ncbi:MAG: hypothetical protein H7039_13340 [Bryobacteraceae bacterium]|nr:hypothetical protein [Bryobacteraceae bacterium]
MSVVFSVFAAAVSLLWSDPGTPVEQVDFTKPARNVSEPQAPFRFIREELSGNSPKVLVQDASGRTWQVKGGPEGRADAFATRLVSALGYYADAICFLRQGTIVGVQWPLRRASGFIQRDGTFTYAAFELRDSNARFLDGNGWLWWANEFSATPELRALRVLVMLLSDWDNKDARNASLGSNTGILRFETNGETVNVYFVVDWGQSLGSWGHLFGWGRSNWNCNDYRRQSGDFLREHKDGRLLFGFRGQHYENFGRDVTRSDLRWLVSRLGNISAEQVKAALRASGASPDEELCFASAFLDRVGILKRAAASGTSEIR